MKKVYVEKLYPKGTRIVIDAVDNCIHSIKECKTGIVCEIDDDGEMLIKWDDGGEDTIDLEEICIHKIGKHDVPLARRYDKMLGSSAIGNKWLYNLWQVAEFVCDKMKYGDVWIYTEDHFSLLCVKQNEGMYFRDNMEYGHIGDMEYFMIFSHIADLIAFSLKRDGEDEEDSVPTFNEFREVVEEELKSLTSKPLCLERYNVEKYITTEEYSEELKSAYKLLLKRDISSKMFLGGYARSFACYIYKLNEF